MENKKLAWSELSQDQIKTLIELIHSCVNQYPTLKDYVVIEESRQMGLNLLTTKTNLDEYFLFVETDKCKIQENPNGSLFLEAPKLEEDLQKLFKDNQDFQILEDPTIICLDLGVPKETSQADIELAQKAKERPFIERTDQENSALFDKVFSLDSRQQFASQIDNIVRKQCLFDGKGIILICLRRFNFEQNQLSNKHQFKTSMLVNIKGAQSLAQKLMMAVQSEFIDPYFEKDNSNGMYVRNINCIGYAEYQNSDWTRVDKQSEYQLFELNDKKQENYKISIIAQTLEKVEIEQIPSLKFVQIEIQNQKVTIYCDGCDKTIDDQAPRYKNMQKLDTDYCEQCFGKNSEFKFWYLITTNEESQNGKEYALQYENINLAKL